MKIGPCYKVSVCGTRVFKIAACTGFSSDASFSVSTIRWQTARRSTERVHSRRNMQMHALLSNKRISWSTIWKYRFIHNPQSWFSEPFFQHQLPCYLKRTENRYIQLLICIGCITIFGGKQNTSFPWQLSQWSITANGGSHVVLYNRLYVTSVNRQSAFRHEFYHI